MINRQLVEGFFVTVIHDVEDNNVYKFISNILKLTTKQLRRATENSATENHLENLADKLDTKREEKLCESSSV